MFVVKVVNSDTGAPEARYYTNSVTEAKDLAYVIVSQSSDDSEKSKSAIDKIEDNFERIVGTRHAPGHCKFIFDSEQNYELLLYEDNTTICHCMDF